MVEKRFEFAPAERCLNIVNIHDVPSMTCYCEVNPVVHIREWRITKVISCHVEEIDRLVVPQANGRRHRPARIRVFIEVQVPAAQIPITPTGRYIEFACHGSHTRIALAEGIDEGYGGPRRKVFGNYSLGFP